MITGFDVSHWQTPSNRLAQQRAAFGDKFAIVKSTDGTATDPASKAHLANFARVGLACGAYIFYRSTKDPAAQARKLLEATKDHVLPMGLWLDYENGSGVDLPDDLLTFLTTLDDGYAGTIGIYTGPAWWRQTIGSDPRFARFPLWLAQYPNRHKDGTTTPDAITTKAPAPWDVADIWQFTDSAGHLDRNVCTAATFAHLTGDPAHNPEDNMTPAQEAKVDQLNAKLDEALPILRKLDADYLTKGKSVRQVLLHTDETVKDLRALLPKAKG